MSRIEDIHVLISEVADDTSMAEERQDAANKLIQEVRELERKLDLAITEACQLERLGEQTVKMADELQQQLADANNELSVRNDEITGLMGQLADARKDEQAARQLLAEPTLNAKIIKEVIELRKENEQLRKEAEFWKRQARYFAKQRLDCEGSELKDLEGDTEAVMVELEAELKRRVE